jgi:hypothetical protein
MVAEVKGQSIASLPDERDAMTAKINLLNKDAGRRK